MKTLFFLLGILHASQVCFAQITEEPAFRLYLIGDAGADDTTEATLLDLGKKLLENENSAVVFLGDNCYRSSLLGLIKYGIKGFDGSRITKARIMSQLNILRGYKGSAYFIPGNHDYWNRACLRSGKKALLKEETFIEDTLMHFSSLKSSQNSFLPDAGDPGPVVREFNEGRIRILLIDSHRLILEEAARKKDTLLLHAFYNNLKQALDEGRKKKQKIILAAHHPILSKGSHSAPLKFYERIFRRFANSNINYPPYNRMALHLDSLMKEQNYPGIYYVAGHEHSLEYFFNDSLHYLVSGAGSKVAHVDYRETVQENEFFIWNEEGFFEIEFYETSERVLIHHCKDPKSIMEVHCLIGCK